MAKLWVKFKTNNVVKVSTDQCQDVDDFLKACKKELSSTLVSYDVDQLSLSTTDGGTPLQPGDAIPAQNTSKTPLFITVTDTTPNKKMWEGCPNCNKPLNNEANIKTVRKIIAGSGLAGAILGGIALPFLGFGLGGITAGSFAASVQGPAVVAGSLFAVLQSLGATGMGILLFGSIGAAVGVLAPFTAKLGWCNGCNDADTDTAVKGDYDSKLL
ncbi:hypothetical protein BC833DRAFT_580266 [Globomyces pollinis-pini]|nr:hypothetical protein BC833DRAFT_580266 [Globomyces pollinis-pini]